MHFNFHIAIQFQQNVAKNTVISPNDLISPKDFYY